MYRVKHGAVIG